MVVDSGPYVIQTGNRTKPIDQKMDVIYFQKERMHLEGLELALEELALQENSFF